MSARGHRSRAALTPWFLCAAAAVLGCRPFGLEGDRCDDGPCALGLVCVEEVCTRVDPPPPPPPPCETDAQCTLNGTADGRECVNGVCRFSDCVIDLQCGVRICDDGRCADRVFCLAESDCAPRRICVDFTCRTPCFRDQDCPLLGGLLQACLEGECVQRCLGDFMCLGGICQDNLCLDPACAVDEECTGPGDYFCEGGRCVQFTPCAIDSDCFDPNFFCDSLGRCAERPACTVDAQCGPGLCVDRHCRDAVACADDDTCGPGEECVASRCVGAPECRIAADCTSPQLCDRGRCREVGIEPAAAIVIRASALVAFVGDEVTLAAQAFDDDGLPIAAGNHRWSAGEALEGSRVGVRCATPGTVDVVLQVFADDVLAHEIVGPSITCVADTAAELDVLVIDGDSGEPVAGAEVFIDDAAAGATDASGHFAAAVFSGGDVGARTADGIGAAVVGAAPGRLYLALPGLAALAGATGQGAVAAGFRALVNGSGDELGDVGLALALAPVESPLHASLGRVLGEPFVGAVELPIVGTLPVVLPATAIMDATLAFAGPQEVKSTAFAISPPGPSQILAYEGRFEQQRLFEVAFGADPTETALGLAAEAEGMDVALVGAGILEALPLVPDSSDVDGDGNTGELAPDWLAFPLHSIVPVTPPLERVGLRTSPPPAGARARMLASCGVELPSGFLLLGVSALVGAEPTLVAASEQVKVLSPPGAVDAHGRACAVHAVFDDGATSAVVARARAFGPRLDAGPLLAPPRSAFILDGIPEVGRSSVVVPAVPNADALALTIFDGATTWSVVAGARGSVPLPTWLSPVVLVETAALRLGAEIAESLARPQRGLREEASAVSTSP
jgi:hypothetical protein